MVVLEELNGAVAGAITDTLPSSALINPWRIRVRTLLIHYCQRHICRPKGAKRGLREGCCPVTQWDVVSDYWRQTTKIYLTDQMDAQ